MNKIVGVRFTEMPKSIFDPMPQVFGILEDGAEILLFSYYPDEISFSEQEFIGLSVSEARYLKFKKDKLFLQS